MTHKQCTFLRSQPYFSMSHVDEVIIEPQQQQLETSGITEEVMTASNINRDSEDQQVVGTQVQDAGNEGEDDEEADELYISVAGDPTKRTPVSEFIVNDGLRAALATAVSFASGDIPSSVSHRCDCTTIAHNLLSCSHLHAMDEVLRVSKVTSVRIKSLIQNAGFTRLLEQPKGPSRMCSSTKADHDVMACKSLHLDPQCVYMGRERLGYFPEELIDNQGLRQLLQNREFTGRWCTNTARHEPKTCLFIHKAPPRGQTVGKRKNLNLKKTDHGKAVIAVQATALFDNRKKAAGGSATINHSETIPEFAKEHQKALDRLVALIDDDDTTADEMTVPADQATVSPALSASKSKTAAAVKSKAARSSGGDDDDSSTLPPAAAHHVISGKGHDRFGRLFASLHPAVLVMLVAIFLALLMPLLPQ